MTSLEVNWVLQGHIKAKVDLKTISMKSLTMNYLAWKIKENST